MPGELIPRAATARFSIVIPVHDDWEPLEQCLNSLESQADVRELEVIVVDDGSRDPAPEFIRQRKTSYALSIVRQPNAGIAAARNRGVQESRGEVLVFTDADCRFQANCLSALVSTLAASPQHNCFQLHLTGECSNLVGRAEELRLTAIQDQMLQADGRIRYLNTAGFAIRRSHPSFKGAGFFDPIALRGEDTLLLATLIREGELPFFVRSAVVQHSISRSLLRCLRKDAQSAWREGKTFQIIAATGVRLRMTNRERLGMLGSAWRIAGRPTIGRVAWMVLASRQLVARTVSLIYGALRGKSSARAAIDTA